ncbi:hypothetical protein Clacol_001256 [Clathrus columnatus]|uniref:LysM domain-containing protein n=1 Tax=Clathrus columnatus TaxID=1419009 RepID=A0AAV5A0G7_9AGAM|nr:hypothetical protein Clacol_001256 [Clathrus columnatus]
MPRLNSYPLVALALSMLTSASPLSSRQFVIANGTNTAECAQFHTVFDGETCLTIEMEFGITDALFRSLNPEINSGCTNLVQGLAYCVQMTSSSTPPPINVANGTIVQGCTQFFTVPLGDSCPDIETKFNISDALFHELNPEVNTLCSNLIAGAAYCVGTSNSTTGGSPPTGPPTNIAMGTIIQGCTNFFTVQSGDSCPTIETMFNITGAFLRALNPEINTDCSNLISGEAYCVQTNNTSIVIPPNNVVPGTITTGCTEFFTVQSGNTCQTIEQEFNITLTSFITLNPEINEDCTNLLLGGAYCVQAST